MGAREQMIPGRQIVGGTAEGPILWTDTALSFWGGVDAESGTVIDRRHPLCGQCMSGMILCMPRGRGSCSSSGILLEMIRVGTAPAAILTIEAEGVLSVGAVIGKELYGVELPICTVSPEDFHRLKEENDASVSSDGTILLR